MDRYRVNGQQDDPSGNVGDTGFEGANYYDRPENLKEGQVQAAVNIDFTQGVAATRGGFVCIPELGATSFNASTPWLSRTSAANKGWQGQIAYGNGRFVAIQPFGAGSDDVMTSSDGVTWSLHSSGINKAWRSVVYGNGLFVAVADASSSTAGNRVMTSPDGTVWTTRTTPADYDWKSVTYGDGKFAAVGGVGAGTKQIMTSTNGISWSLQDTIAETDVAWYGITYGNGLFVAVGYKGVVGRVMTSPDAVTWTERTSSLNQFLYAVAYGNGVFVASSISSPSSINGMYSYNGVDWTNLTFGFTDVRALAYGNGVFVAVGDPDTAYDSVATSTNGVTWTMGTAPSTQEWYGVAYGNGTFVAVPGLVAAATVMTKSYYSTPSVAGAVMASCVYSDPNTPTDTWVALAGESRVGFYSFGRTSRSVSYPANFTLSEQATLVQANNQLFLFPGEGQTPIYWDGNWSNSFAAVPASTLGAGFESIPQSNQATYYQNRLWVVNGKDQVAASDILDFEEYDTIANDFNLNTGSADYVVCTIPFGDNSLVVFKHNSSVLLENVQGSLNDVTATEISRNLGIIGINAVTAVGPDLVYVSDRNISTIRLNLQNKLQNVTEPLSRNIGPIIGRINWQYAYKISLGYWDNRLFVAVPTDDSVVCNTILVYNFITQQWYGEWNFSDAISMNVQGFVVANYLGQLRLHVITEDGRIFVTDQGPNDISGSTVAEITTSFTARAYNTANNAHKQRRAYIDIETNRPNFSVTAYVDGANEYSTILTNQTYTRSQSWKFNDSTYTLTNANDDYNRAFRKDYSTGPNSIQPQSGFLPEMNQSIRLPLITRRQGRLSWLKIDNTQGFMLTRSVGFEATAGQRSNLVQI